MERKGGKKRTKKSSNSRAGMLEQCLSPSLFLACTLPFICVYDFKGDHVIIMFTYDYCITVHVLQSKY